MALTYVYAVSPAGASATSLGFPVGGPVLHSYTPNSAGIITGVTPGDAVWMNVQGGTNLTKLCCTGATADRPLPGPQTAPGANLTSLAPVFGDVMFDTTLGVPIWYVGYRSSTGWVNSAGSAV
jgi:hypothetical protein